MRLSDLCFGLISGALMYTGSLMGHCQMPCGIYHDDIVFDEIDQYIETMHKGISVLTSSKFGDTKEKNEFIRWVVEKEKASDTVAELITRYFLQQKIKPGEPDTVKKVTSAHLLLFTLVGIKQNTALSFVEDFAKEWEKFKLMFHREGYECIMEQLKLKKMEDALKKAGQEHQGDGQNKDDEKQKPAHNKD